MLLDIFKHYAQNIQDNAKRVLENRGADPEATEKACDILIEAGKDGPDARILGFAYYYKAENCYVLNDPEEFLKNIVMAMAYLEGTNQWDLIAKAYNFLGIMSMSRGNAPFALDYYLTALKYCKDYELDEVEIMVNINIGVLHYEFGDKETSRRHYEECLRLLRTHPAIYDHDVLLMNVYFGLINNCLSRNDPQTARNYLEMCRFGGKVDLDPILKLGMYMMEARVYQGENKQQLRDTAISRVSAITQGNFPLLDVFEDMYHYCEMLLDAEKYDELWETINRLEKMASRTGVHYIQKRLLELKIQYYRIYGDNAGYLQATGLYYELSKILEKENTAMIGKMLNMRNTLEETAKRTKVMRMEKEAFKAKSETDALTGLSNRFRLHDEAAKVFKEAKEKRLYFGIEIMDVDYFKGFNDNYGHQAGDRCIKAVADQIGSMQEKPNIFAARYGGDEFVLLYKGYDKDAIEEVMGELREKIVAMAMPHEYSKAASYVTISQGACCGIPKESEAVSDYLEAADNMLYQIKEVSRNSFLACEFQSFRQSC